MKQTFSLPQFYGIGQLPQQLQHFILRYVFLQSLIIFVDRLGQLFILLHYLDTLGFAKGSFMLSIIILTQLVTDYPTGSLSDYLGNKIVLLGSISFIGIAYLFIGFVQSPISFLIASIFFGLGIAQNSGALESWFDNHYQLLAKEADPDRTTYGFAQHRLMITLLLVQGISYLFSGMFASIFTRIYLFRVCSILLFLLIPVIFVIMTQTEKQFQIPKPKGLSAVKQHHNYLTMFTSGLKFLFSTKSSFMLLVGLAVLDLGTLLWFFLFLFPVIFGYTGSDFILSLLRSFLFIFGTIGRLLSSRLIPKLNRHNLGIMYLLQYTVFFGGLTILLLFNPPTNSLNITALVVFIVLAIVGDNILGSLNFALRRQIMIDYVPSNHRNSVYSLVPTITLILQFPLMIIFGKETEVYGIASSLLIILLIGIIGSAFLMLFKESTKVSITSSMPIASVA